MGGQLSFEKLVHELREPQPKSLNLVIADNEWPTDHDELPSAERCLKTRKPEPYRRQPTA